MGLHEKGVPVRAGLYLRVAVVVVAAFLAVAAAAFAVERTGLLASGSADQPGGLLGAEAPEAGDPALSVSKSAAPEVVPESGADVTYTVTVTNEGGESLTLGAITDQVGADEPLPLEDLDPAPPAELAPGATYSASFTRHVSGDAPGSLTDVVTVSAFDDEGNPTSASDDATVRLLVAPARQARGGDFSVVIKPDGSLWSYGDNGFGQLGLGATTLRVVPTRVGGASDWAAVACGGFHTLALKTDGTLWAWGANAYGQLGLGDVDDRSVPVQVGLDDDWVAVDAGTRHSLALKADGSLWAWGQNASGQLGLGDRSTRLLPTRVGDDNDWAMVRGGLSHTVAIKDDRTLWAWGHNLRYQLGLGDTVTRLTPTRVGDDADWTDLSCGDEDARALKADGSLWAWGFNSYGQLGVGDTATRQVPTRVGDESDWARVACGDDHTLALKDDGSLWAWGDNTYGQLGQGDRSPRTTPARVGDGTDWLDVVCGDDTSAAVRADGGVWNWGDNVFGQLGLGDAVDRTDPVFAFFLDDVSPPPIATLVSPSHPDPSAWYADPAPSFEWSADDDSGIGGYKWVMDASPAGQAPVGFPFQDTTTSYAGIADGSWYFHVRTVDRAGNWGPTETLRVNIDTAAPMTTDDADGRVHQSYTLHLTADDLLSGVAETWYRIDDRPWRSGDVVPLRLVPSPKRNPLRPGVHTVEYYSVDAAGNREDTKSCEVELQWLRVRLIGPNGGESVPQDGELDVSWQLSRPIDTGSFDLWAESPTTGSYKLTTEPIAVVPVQTDYAFHWSVAHPPADDYRVRVAYSDGGNVLSQDSSDDAFEITAVPQDPDARELVALGPHAYVAAGAAGLQVYDVSDPGAPALLGTRDTRGIASDVAVAGDYAYVADGAAGIEVVDVSDPAAPRLVANLPLASPARRVSLSSGRLLHGFETLSGWTTTAGALALDTAHVREGSAALMVAVPPATSARVATGDVTWDLSRDTRGVQLWVYLRSVGAPPSSGGGSVSLRIYLSNAATNLSNAFYTGSNFTVHEGWNLLRFSSLDWKTLGSPSWDVPIRRIALDVSAPSDRGYEVSFDDLRAGVTGLKPAFLWTFDDGYDETWRDVLPYLSAVGRRATLFVRTKWVNAGGSKITLAHLRELYDAGWAIGNHTMDHVDLTTLDRATVVEQVQGGHDWLVDNGFPRAADYFAYPFNASNEAVVSAIEECGVTAARNGGNRTQQVPVDERYLITSFGFDESTPSFDLWKQRVDRAVASGTTLVVYAHAFNDTTLPVFHDIVDYLAAQGVWSPTIDEWWTTLAAQAESAEAAAGRYIHVACDEGVEVVDVSDPLDPRRVAAVDLPGPARDVAVAGDLVATAAGSAGLQVVDATEATAPTLVGESPAATSALGVFATDGLVYLAEGTDGLRIVSLADPAAPTTAGSCDTPGDARDVVVVGGYAYVADGPQGVQIVDVHDPAAPLPVATLTVAGEADALVVFGGRACVATGAGGLQIVDVSLP